MLQRGCQGKCQGWSHQIISVRMFPNISSVFGTINRPNVKDLKAADRPRVKEHVQSLNGQQNFPKLLIFMALSPPKNDQEGGAKFPASNMSIILKERGVTQSSKMQPEARERIQRTIPLRPPLALSQYPITTYPPEKPQLPNVRPATGGSRTPELRNSLKTQHIPPRSPTPNSLK